MNTVKYRLYLHLQKWYSLDWNYQLIKKQKNLEITSEIGEFSHQNKTRLLTA